MDKINLPDPTPQPAKGGGQGFWQCRCVNAECDVLTYEDWTNDRTSPSQSLCPFCCEPGEKISDTERTTKEVENG